MPNLHKMTQISSTLGEKFDSVIKKMYLNKKMCSKEISDKISNLSKVSISPRSIQRRLKFLGVIRSYAEAFNLSIKKGRKTYEALKRPIRSSEFRKGINIKLRYKIMSRDNFKCKLCGKTAEHDILVIDHIKPVTYGGKNEESNLRTLCRGCNHGKMLNEERKIKL